MIKVIKEQLGKLADESSTTTAASESTESTDVTSSSKAPAASAHLTNYTPEDLSEIEKVYSAVSSWFEEKSSEQDKRAVNQDAAFTVAEIQSKARELNDSIMKLLQRKMREQQKSAAAESRRSKSAKAASSSASASSSTSSATSSADSPESTEATDEGSAPPDFDPSMLDGIRLELGENGETPSKEKILEAVERAKKEKEEKKGKKGKKHDEL